MIVLGFESSCDETACALVEDGRLIAEHIASQADLHSLFGGVVPELASREHLRLIHRLHQRVLDDAEISPQDIDVVAAARGPGLLGSLLVGLSYAKGVALACDVPLIGINHLQAHLLVAELEQPVTYPALGVLVSGGHTQTVLMESALQYHVLGKTLDDAAGEAFDKAAKALNLPYPGGRLIDILGQNVPPDRSLFPRPYIDNDNLDFSFSGLKTAVSTFIDQHPHLRLKSMPASPDATMLESFPHELKVVCSSLMWSIADALRIKVERALKRTPEVQSIIVAGGVAANSRIRQTMGELAREHNLAFHVPRPAFCMDNAAMIAYAGWKWHAAGYQHALNIDAIARGGKIPDDMIRVNTDTEKCLAEHFA
ncbi:tRNA (adenosine(37)-N6)-threonylcarbamoyltransferase complex transferase subunit TsaD [Desulfovibrio inopinatus]|uniref:tRNA (adenosine(37)-N6)-threonylcarbamoyltransferase complex transferase subunit TsaD n=1 Tax=Desulfovibrio inopinatus TaxID=102109 RepID=UPI0004112101|nr:tRNA (adenosine(37)-N6)-threonylcarbamoyltransferase complex transferase subunit TsaD [Desulfovibrio inopinatus]